MEAMSEQTVHGGDAPLVLGWVKRHGFGWSMVGLAVVITFLAPRTDGGYLRQAADFASGGGNTGYLALGIVGLLVLAWAAKSKMGFWCVASVMLVETALVHLVKFTTGNLLGWFPRPSAGPGGFPSGHAAAACALAFLLTERMPRAAPVWYAIAAVISWSRVEAGAHYPYQVVGGALLGLAVAIILSRRFDVTKP